MTFARGHLVGVTEAKPDVSVTPHAKIGSEPFVFEDR
jgi:hypothetical protein